MPKENNEQLISGLHDALNYILTYLDYNNIKHYNQKIVLPVLC